MKKEGNMNIILGVLVAVVATLVLAAAPEAGAVATPTPILTTASGWDLYTSCVKTCQANTAGTCASIPVRQVRSEVNQMEVALWCACGLLVCANVCVTDSGEPLQTHPLPQVCRDIGAD
jgi:uncharacterized membrane protein